MTKKMYVGNLPFSSTEEDVQDLFSQYGEVESVKIIYDKETGRSRGFGFVELSEETAQEAMRTLDGNKFAGRTLKINEAKPRK